MKSNVLEKGYTVLCVIFLKKIEKTSKNLSLDYALISFMILSVLRAKFSIYPDYGLFSMIFLKET